MFNCALNLNTFQLLFINYAPLRELLFAIIANRFLVIPDINMVWLHFNLFVFVADDYFFMVEGENFSNNQSTNTDNDDLRGTFDLKKNEVMYHGFPVTHTAEGKNRPASDIALKF